MPSYGEQISRTTPSAFIFLIDQSGSMGDVFGRVDSSGNSRTKAEEVADALNIQIEEIISRCRKPEGTADYFSIGIIGYGPNDAAQFCWSGQLSGRELVRLSDVEASAEFITGEIESSIQGKLIKEEIQLKKWVSPVADGYTPMRHALDLASTAVESWMKANPNSFPPIVINITDGIATDSTSEELIAASKHLGGHCNANGSAALLINCHISSLNNFPVVFPANKSELPQDQYAQTLFEMSSVLPDTMQMEIANTFGKTPGAEKCRGMVFNGNAVLLLKFLRIGTIPTVRNLEK